MNYKIDVREIDCCTECKHSEVWKWGMKLPFSEWKLKCMMIGGRKIDNKATIPEWCPLPDGSEIKK